MERATGRLRICFANQHRLQGHIEIHEAVGGNSAELSVPTSSSVDGAGNGTSARPRRGRAPASGACRRLRLLATNASRLLDARTLSGSSPGALLKKSTAPE